MLLAQKARILNPPMIISSIFRFHSDCLVSFSEQTDKSIRNSPARKKEEREFRSRNIFSSIEAILVHLGIPSSFKVANNWGAKCKEVKIRLSDS